jgi:chaperonin cofactor prefoldin
MPTAETEIESNDTRVAALNEQLSAAGRQIDALNAAIIRLLADAGI